jgi:glycosyltransferase involved in cell wall biosynthesis
VLSFHARDEAALRGAVAEPGRLHRLRPFLDAQPFAAAADARDAHRARIAAELGLDPATPWLLAVGMMRPGDKLASYRVLAQALAACTDRPWTLLVAGDGPARPAVEAAFGPLGWRTRLLGACAPARLAALCAAADLFVWPAINEAWGMALLEAQAAGLPAIAGDAGGVGEILRDGRTGWLVPAGDVRRFAHALGIALDDPATRRAFGAAARATVAAEHGLDAAGRGLERILAGTTRLPA